MGAFIRRYLALATKEVQQLRRNPGLIIQLMIPPTIVLVIFGFALNPRVRDLRLGVVDQNLTVESRDFIDALTQNINFNVTRVYSSTGEAERALKNLDLDLFLVIPHDFDRMLKRGQTASIQVVIDAVDANTAQIAQGYLQRAMEDYNTSGGAVPVADFRPRRTIIRSTHPAPPPGAVEVRSAYVYNPGLVTSWHYVTGVMSIIMFINASLVASALAVKEKETGTIEQLLMTPAQTGEMLLAKTTPVFVLMMVVMFIALGTGVLVFDLPLRGAIVDVCSRRRVRCAGRNWNRRDGGDCFEIPATGPVTDVLRQPADHAAVGCNFTNREHAGVLSEALVSGPTPLLSNHRAGCDIERRAVERTVAEPCHFVGVRGRSVLDQRLAVPEAVTEKRCTKAWRSDHEERFERRRQDQSWATRNT